MKGHEGFNHKKSLKPIKTACITFYLQRIGRCYIRRVPWLRVVLCCVVLCGVMWCYVVWCGVVWCGVA
jgi:hypothetical protein